MASHTHWVLAMLVPEKELREGMETLGVELITEKNRRHARARYKPSLREYVWLEQITLAVYPSYDLKFSYPGFSGYMVEVWGFEKYLFRELGDGSVDAQLESYIPLIEKLRPVYAYPATDEWDIWLDEGRVSEQRPWKEIRPFMVFGPDLSEQLGLELLRTTPCRRLIECSGPTFILDNTQAVDDFSYNFYEENTDTWLTPYLSGVELRQRKGEHAR